jgi:VanZ family protein
MTLLLRLLAWLLAAAVTLATLGPPDLRPHSDLGQDGEHAFAFVLVGLAFGLAYSRRRGMAAAIAVVLIGVLELLQLVAPGRHARLEDFLVDALTACVGFVLAAVADRVMTCFRARAPTVTSEGPAE